MGKLNSFTFTTLNGYFKGPNGDISWHKHDPSSEENEYGKEGVRARSILLFGRVTYDLMASSWPTEQVKKMNPEMAEGMNSAEKIVFSKKLKNADWNNTRVVSNMLDEIKKLKKEPGVNMTVLGSGSILTQLAENDLIDEYQLMVDPIAIGDGTPLFEGIKHMPELKLTSSRTFKSGAVLLTYESKKK